MSPVSAAHFVFLAISFSVSIPVFASVPSISQSCLFLLRSLCPCGSVPIAQSLRVSPCVSVSVYISPAPAVCLSSSFQTLTSLPSLCLSLSVFLSWSRPQPLAAMPPWPEPGAVLASAAPSRLPACPSSSWAGSGQCGHPTPASQQPARRGRCSGDFRQEYLHATPGTENSLEPVSSPTP